MPAVTWLVLALIIGSCVLLSEADIDAWFERNSEAHAGGVLDPTYNVDVKPILDANCIMCHTTPPGNGAPSSFRLDICETEGDWLGARDKAERIVARTGDGTMPQGGSPLPQSDLDTLANWLADSAPCDGDPDSDENSDSDSDEADTDDADTHTDSDSDADSCEDRLDDDEDGWTDTADPDCGSGIVESGFGTGQCNDGEDNDGDGTVDALDLDCVDASDCAETPVRLCSGLLITEVMAHAENESTDEYVEVWNGTGSEIDLAGLTITDGDSTDSLVAYSGSTTRIAAGDYALIVDSNYSGNYRLASDLVLVTTGDATLGNGLSTSDGVAIKDASASTTLASYGFPFDPGDGIAAELLDPDLGDAAGNWVAATCADGSSPGEDNCVWK